MDKYEHSIVYINNQDEVRALGEMGFHVVGLIQVTGMTPPRLVMERKSPPDPSPTDTELVAEISRCHNAISVCVGMIEEYGTTEGEHHKTWLIDQIARNLLGPLYEDWRRQFIEDDGDDEMGWDRWSEGTPP